MGGGFPGNQGQNWYGVQPGPQNQFGMGMPTQQMGQPGNMGHNGRMNQLNNAPQSMMMRGGDQGQPQYGMGSLMPNNFSGGMNKGRG
mmetsp:Transcript_5435/g.9166  ORF Transcript_5435/g.9166 Transcript_5435/m.9166 type:complete len:87 (-) Transcript_5435:1018-1278(-)